MKKDIINRDSNGNRHGKYERYYPNGKLKRRCNYDMGLKIGIEETHKL